MTNKPLYQSLMELIGEDPLSIIKRVISNYTFIDYGIVQEYTEGRIKVKLAHQLLEKDIFLENIEVLTTGSKALSTRYTLVSGDIVQLMSSRSLVDTIAELTVATMNTAMAYDTVTIKALPMADYANAKNKIDILDDGSMTITGNGYTIEITTDGTLKISGKAIELNGNGKRFVLWEDFNSKYQALINLINAHIHTSSGSGGPTSVPTIAISSDINSAKTTTLKTDG